MTQALLRSEQWVEIWFKMSAPSQISAPPCSLANSAVMSTLTAHSRWEDRTAKKGFGYAEEAERI